jgi:hypothetical protein
VLVRFGEPTFLVVWVHRKSTNAILVNRFWVPI